MQAPPKQPIPPVTDADRAAAFPQGLAGHSMGGEGLNFMVLFDRAEWQGGSDGHAHWDTKTWIGGDINRLWIRADGETGDGRTGVAPQFDDITLLVFRRLASIGCPS